MTTATVVETTQVYQLFIKATPEAIWQALLEPEFTEQYFYGTRIETTLEPGSPFVSHMASDGSTAVEGTVVEADPPRRLVHTWSAKYSDELAAEPESRVSWEIEPQEGGYCKLTVVHDELERSPQTAAGVAGGWMLVLSGLKTLLETGAPLA